MNDDLSTRFAAFEAREAIRDLVIRYGMAVDDRDMATVESMFTEDATFGQGDITLGSRQEIVDFYTDRLKAFGATYHYTNGHVVDLGGPDTATGVVNAHAELSLQDRTFISGMRYYDQYRHVDNRWKFAHRQLRDHLLHGPGRVHRRRLGSNGSTPVLRRRGPSGSAREH